MTEAINLVLDTSDRAENAPLQRHLWLVPDLPETRQLHIEVATPVIARLALGEVAETTLYNARQAALRVKPFMTSINVWDTTVSPPRHMNTVRRDYYEPSRRLSITHGLAVQDYRTGQRVTFETPEARDAYIFPPKTKKRIREQYLFFTALQ